FGFCEIFDPQYQPWTGGGQHFSFLNQPAAAERNFHMFCLALGPLLASHPDALQQLEEIRSGFADVMQRDMEAMWAAKLGLESFHPVLFSGLATLMMQTNVDYTIFFRELSSVPSDIAPLQKSFYKGVSYEIDREGMDQRWSEWLTQWQSLTGSQPQSRDELSKQMKLINPKYSWREWLVVPAYQQAAEGSYALVRELQEVMTQPYAEQSKEVEEKYYRLKPSEFRELGGLSHYSCSS
ncbi:MAG: YdiU family protein, partial [Amphritea sp.]|nr:YdiU family protein [Amphritea sp.]